MSDLPFALEGDVFAQLLRDRLPESPEEMRALLGQFAGLLNAGIPEIGGFHEAVPVRVVDGVAVTADVMVPRGAGPHPVLVYLHGGGWICGSPATHRKLCHRFAEAGLLTFSIDYRLAPEHPFPAPFDDCAHAVGWAAREARRYGGDASRLAVGGDSAGGNLAAAVAAGLADDASAPQIRAALLIYGVYDFAAMDTTVTAIAAEDSGLTGAAERLVELMVGSYLGPERSDALLADPRISPVHAASKLPPCHVMVGSADGLAGQAADLAAALARADIVHEYVVYDAMPHGFSQMEFLPRARESIDQMVEFLRKHLGP
jgi:acetyl esterase